MLKKLFGFDPAESTIKKEIVAGITTFLTMSYILAVNPSMFGLLDGMPQGAVFTTTALAAIIGCPPVFLPGKFHGQRSLAGYSPWGHKESDVTE